MTRGMEKRKEALKRGEIEEEENRNKGVVVVRRARRRGKKKREKEGDKEWTRKKPSKSMDSRGARVSGGV